MELANDARSVLFPPLFRQLIAKYAFTESNAFQERARSVGGERHEDAVLHLFHPLARRAYGRELARRRVRRRLCRSCRLCRPLPHRAFGDGVARGALENGVFVGETRDLRLGFVGDSTRAFDE